MKMKAALIKAVAVFLLLASLAGCGNEPVEVTPSPEVQSAESTQDYFSHPIRKLASTMAHDHLKANIDYLNAICDAFEASGKNVLSIDLFPSDEDSIDEAVKELPEELGNTIREYISNAVFCDGDHVSIELYNLEYWRGYDERELRNYLADGMYDPAQGDFVSGWDIDRILVSLEYITASKVCGKFEIFRFPAVSDTLSFEMNFNYYENSEDISGSDSVDGHWIYYGEYDVMSGL